VVVSVSGGLAISMVPAARLARARMHAIPRWRSLAAASAAPASW